jgi:hypothetical protein
MVKVLYLYFLSYPLYNIAALEVAGRGIRIDWLVIALLGYLTYCRFSLGKAGLRKDPIFLCLLLLNMAVLASFYKPYMSGIREYRIDFFTAWLQFLLANLLFLTCATISADPKKMTNLIKFLLLVQMLVALFALCQVMGGFFGLEIRLPVLNPSRPEPASGYERITGHIKRVFGPFSEPRNLGDYLLTGYSISFILAMTRQAVFKNRWFRRFVHLSILLAMLATLSLSTFFMMGVLALFMVSYYRTFNVFKIFISLVALIIIALLLDYFLLSSLVSSSIQLRFRDFDINSMWDQLLHPSYLNPANAYGWLLYPTMFREDLDIWLSSPLVGVGVNNVYFYKTFESGSWSIFGALAATGILGAIFLVLLYYSMLKRYVRLTLAEQEGDRQLLAQIGLFLIITQICSTFVSEGSFCGTYYWTNLALAMLILTNLEKHRRGINSAPASGPAPAFAGVIPPPEANEQKSPAPA